MFPSAYYNSWKIIIKNLQKTFLSVWKLTNFAILVESLFQLQPVCLFFKKKKAESDEKELFEVSPQNIFPWIFFSSVKQF